MKRFNPHLSPGHEEHEEQMYEVPDGKYVLFEDIAEIAREVARETAVAEVAAHLEEDWYVCSVGGTD